MDTRIPLQGSYLEMALRDESTRSTVAEVEHPSGEPRSECAIWGYPW